jgi:hypothetical protein
MIVDRLENPARAQEKVSAIRDVATRYVSWERISREYKRILWNIKISG